MLELRAAVALSAVLAVVAVVWLRQLIDAGLRGEAAERPIGPEIACANCRDLTPRHTFCAWCGIALAALPKGRESEEDGFVAGSEPARLRSRLVLAVFAGALVSVAVVSSGALASLAPAEQPQTCFPGQPCGGPPSASPLVVSGEAWKSSGGVALEFDAGRWEIEGADDSMLRLVSRDGGGSLEIRVEQARDGPTSEVHGLPRWLKSPTRLELPVPHGPNIGYVDGRGAWYEGLLDSPQGPRQTVTVATLSSGHALTSVSVSAVFFGPAEQAFAGEAKLRSSVDTILNTVTWPLGPAGRTAGTSVDTAGGSGRPGGLRPEDVARAYGILPLWQRGFRGRGETVAVVSLDTFRAEDITEYERAVGIEGAPPVERILVDGEVPLGAGAKEVSLDLEVLRAVAPEASIVDYEAPLGWEGFIAALKRINDDGRARVVSVSWGKCLTHVEAAVVKAMEHELDRARRAGRTIFVSSGDSGAFSCLHSENELDPDQHRAVVDWPAASPNVIAVGGTRLSLREDGSYYAENGWEDTLSSDGSGGGVSPLHLRPRWQRASALPGSSPYRRIPDVAGPADCDSAFFVVYPEWTGDDWAQRSGPYGCGTSAAAPFWAGVAALVLQYAREQGHERPGFFGDLLYTLPRTGPGGQALNDVRTGGNLLDDAVPGWDYATGLGTPDAWSLARAIVARLARPPGDR
jgi:hypothetical protein